MTGPTDLTNKNPLIQSPSVIIGNLNSSSGSSQSLTPSPQRRTSPGNPSPPTPIISNISERHIDLPIGASTSNDNPVTNSPLPHSEVKRNFSENGSITLALIKKYLTGATEPIPAHHNSQASSSNERPLPIRRQNTLKNALMHALKNTEIHFPQTDNTTLKKIESKNSLAAKLIELLQGKKIILTEKEFQQALQDPILKKMMMKYLITAQERLLKNEFAETTPKEKIAFGTAAAAFETINNYINKALNPHEEAYLSIIIGTTLFVLFFIIITIYMKKRGGVTPLEELRSALQSTLEARKNAGKDMMQAAESAARRISKISNHRRSNSTSPITGGIASRSSSHDEENPPINATNIANNTTNEIQLTALKNAASDSEA